MVVAIQEALNDDAIGLKCYEEKDKKKAAAENVGGDADFKLTPKNPRCNSEQVSANYGVSFTATLVSGESSPCLSG